MLAQAATSTRIIRAESAAELATILDYAAPDGPVLLIRDQFPVDSRDRLIAELSSSRPMTVMHRVRPDPAAADVTAMATEAASLNPAIVLAIGGGSTIDSAKGVAALLSNGGELEQYLGPLPLRKVERREVRLVAVPTTAGTGSEVTKVGVYTAASGRKYTLANPLLQPDIAVHMPSLSSSMPPGLTAATGFDALSHALEPLWNRNATPLSTRLAVDAAASILRHIERAYESSRTGDSAGRIEMLQAATHAGVAFNLTGTAMVHAISFILGEQWHVPHGAACAFTLEDALLYHAAEPIVQQRIGCIAAALGANPSDPIHWLYELLVDLKKRLHLPFRFADIEVKLSEQEIPALFNKSLEDPKMRNTLRPVDAATLLGFLRNKL